MFQLHISISVSIISIDTKGIILFHKDKFVARVSCTSVLGRVIIGLAPVGVLLVIFTSSIYILVFYTSIYAQLIYKLIFIFDLFIN